MALSGFTYSFAQTTESPAKPFKFLVTGALESGGDKVGEVMFTNGDTQAIKAGNGVTLSVGAQYQIPQAEKFLLRGTVGFKYVTTAADNAHIRLTRFPLQLTGNFMATEKLRFGAGVVTHQGISLNTDGLGENEQFESGAGAVFEIAYSAVGLSYTVLNYQHKNKHTVSANAIGITFSLTFPKNK
ncbi:hypothetical protein FOE74_11145 [Rufibacter glacialis]|uniref:Porin family protein n=1 Tax=Rufibacter glacialis TaxID=1259555 RepID=A0A5M8QFR0_9BACT|nr:hypothetical protein FOE74_11145 [Rufibacter glacialis]